MSAPLLLLALQEVAAPAGAGVLDWIKIASDLSAPAMLIIVIYLGQKGTWVWGHHYKELEERIEVMRAERDEFKTMLLRALNAAEAAVGRKEGGNV
jgi:hypothetical protein